MSKLIGTLSLQELQDAGSKRRQVDLNAAALWLLAI